MPDPRPLRSNDPREVAGFRLTARIGEGAQGSVFLGESDTGRRVAVKLLHAGIGHDDRARTLFERELAAARRVAPFCTARILAAGTDEDVPYIVSEYIDGPSLREHITERGVASGGELVRLAIGTATALAAIHEAGVVHRDFKPANVLLGEDGPRVIDFGIARPLDATSATMTGAVGTPAFMAPEQVAGLAGGAPLDMFAWACTMAFAANGAPPFGSDNVAAIMQRVLHGEPQLGALTGELRALVASCLAKDPAARPTALQLLQRLLGNRPNVNGTPLPAPDADADPSAALDANANPHAAPDADANSDARVSLLAEGTSAAALPSPHYAPSPPAADAHVAHAAGRPWPGAPPSGSPTFGAYQQGTAPIGGPPPPPAGFPQPTGPVVPGRSRRPLLIVVGAAAAVLLVTGGVFAAVLLRDNGTRTGTGGGTSGGGQTVTQSNPSTKTCTYSPTTGQTVKDVGKPPSQVPATQPQRATIKTNLGTLEVQLDPAKAPCTVNSLAHLASKKYYDNTTCHRLTTSETLKVLQCGDPSGTGTGGPSYQFADEIAAGTRYTRGTVAMANAGPNTNGSQFFIIYGDTTSLAPDYTIFGRVTSGLEIVDKVAKAGAEDGSAMGTGDGPPKQKVTITEFRTVGGGG
ncbi:serine/threonine protein kinase [Actinomadura sp. KC06]|uniref:protein kinase domain-containing protein n=1 Tax=Actinomadura sp. KC06 TaxID=2530369 RepID=UPI001050269C|nr:peptidylprolyl isomerase [Actinomadura sp. KC06]TDD23816.1 serine/threonine protein kinase [Actinomadura sp. KC06]